MPRINFEKLAAKYYDFALGTLMEFIMIDSVYDEKTISGDEPYGRGVAKMLKAVDHLGDVFGFERKNIDGRAVELSFGQGKRLISVYSHADVVPPTGIWSNDPFIPFIKDGKIYGRGTSDDKGPMLASFFAIKLLKDNGLIRDFRVKFVVGGDEERGSSCLDYYFDVYHGEIPTYGMTPDADFPVVYGEKGIANFKSTFSILLPNIKSIDAGVVTNAVIDRADVVFDEIPQEFISFLDDRKIEFMRTGQMIRFLGKSAHGSVPELGKNAAIISLNAIADFFQISDLKSFVDKIQDSSGRKFGCFATSSDLGDTTFNIGILKYRDGIIEYVTNFRYPEKIDASLTIQKYDSTLKTKTKLLSKSDVLLFDRKSFLVTTLLNTYIDYVKDRRAKPISLGGGTYAKEAKNTVAFGPTFPNENTHMHEPDEYMNIKNFYKCIAIYADAIYRLGTLKDASEV
ncbi:MAG: Sapep family Mn(2+)-dependent dipeptidase [Bacilli bacterium]|jgi:succinyl-diaminopimelate desuccinylase